MSSLQQKTTTLVTHLFEEFSALPFGRTALHRHTRVRTSESIRMLQRPGARFRRGNLCAQTQKLFQTLEPSASDGISNRQILSVSYPHQHCKDSLQKTWLLFLSFSGFVFLSFPMFSSSLTVICFSCSCCSVRPSLPRECHRALGRPSSWLVRPPHRGNFQCPGESPRGNGIKATLRPHRPG